MGPRHLSRGIQGESGEENRIDPSFNGATAFEPWNQGSQVPRAAVHPCFNGATAFEPWNQGEGVTYAMPILQASMGPRHLSRGIAALAEHARAVRVVLQWGHGI
mgnify:CR=1 FL=1